MSLKSTFAGIKDGFVQWVEQEWTALEPAAEADIAAAQAHFKPLMDEAVNEAASVLKTDGLKIVSDAAAAFAAEGPQAAEKAALVALQAAKVDVSKLSADTLSKAVAAAQATLPKAA